MTHLGSYYAARRIAADLDREGVPPPLVIRFLAGVASLAALGLAGVVCLTAVSFLAWEAGLGR